MKRLVLLIIFLLVGQSCFCSEEPDQNIVDFNLSGFGQKGEKSWEIKAKSADIFSDVVSLSTIEAVVFGKDQNLTLTADKGSYNKSKKIMHVESNVVATTTDGARMTTDSLDWSEASRRMSSPDFVTVQKESLVTTGTGLEANPNLNTVEFKKDVTVQVTPVIEQGQANLDQKPTIITCSGPLEIDYEKKEAIFNNKVKVERPDSNMYSDKMTVYFDIDQKKEAANAAQAPKSDSANLAGTQIKKIVAQGNVKIVQGQNITYSDEAVYTAEDKKVVLTGRPKLIIYSTQELKNAAFGN